MGRVEGIGPVIADQINTWLGYSQVTDPGRFTMAPLTRRHHRVKTHARGWTVQPIHPGAWLWRTRHGHYALVDHHGTTALGKL